jgi:lipopolysaccharide export system permease protein
VAGDAFTIPLALLVGIVSLFIAPWAEERSQVYAEILKRREEISAIAPGVFKETGSGSKVYFIESYGGQHGAATRIFMQDLSEGKVSSIFAQRGYISVNEDNERVLVLEDGRRYVGEPGKSDYEVGSFKRYSVLIGTNQKLAAPPNNRQAQSTSSADRQQRPGLALELVWRLSMPLSCLVLACWPFRLSYYNPRSGHAYNLVVALLAFPVPEQPDTGTQLDYPGQGGDGQHSGCPCHRADSLPCCCSNTVTVRPIPWARP